MTVAGGDSSCKQRWTAVEGNAGWLWKMMAEEGDVKRLQKMVEERDAKHL